jgi:energy-coupling factor transporter ATP-binding protein EcfA2
MSDSLTTKFIEISGVEQTFKTRKGLFPALRDIHLTVAKGEFVALIGHSGCGKSTLLNLIAGLTTPTAGRAAVRQPRDRRPRPGARGGVPEPLAAALADLLRERLPGGGAGVRRRLQKTPAHRPRTRRSSRRAPTPRWRWSA